MNGMPSEAERLAARPLCGPCRDEWIRWLDYQPAPGPVYDVPYGYAATPEGVEYLRRAHAEDVYRTIRESQGLIARLCAEAEHVPWPDGQLDLFAPRTEAA